MMQTVIFEGKEYTKAAVLAERFRYTQDYLGQLCRAKKVDARLVGRAWYVNLESLEQHRKTRYKIGDEAATSNSTKGAQEDTNASLDKQTTVITKKPPNHYLSRIDVEPVLRQKTVKIVQNEAGKLRELPVRYERDDFSLIPKINREAISAPLPISIADSDEISVKKTKDSTRITDFKAEPLPEVYLRGKIGVVGIPEALEQLEETSSGGRGEGDRAFSKTEATPADSVPPRKVTILKNAEPKTESVAVQTEVKKPLKIKLISGKSEANKPAAIPSPLPKEASKTVSAMVPTRPAPKPNNTPLPVKPLKPNEIRVTTAVAASPVAITAATQPNGEIKETGGFVGWFLRVVFLIFTVAVVGLILTAKSTTEVDPTGVRSGVSFDTAQLELLVEKIKNRR